MADIPVPFVDEDVDTDDPTGAMMTVVLLVAGFAVVAFAQMFGDTIASSVSSTIASAVGWNPATGQSDDGGLGVL